MLCPACGKEVPGEPFCAKCGAKLVAAKPHRRVALVVVGVFGCLFATCAGFVGFGLVGSARSAAKVGLLDVERAVSAAASTPVRVSVRMRPVGDKGMAGVIVVQVGKSLGHDEEQHLAQVAWNALHSTEGIEAVCVSTSTGRVVQFRSEHCFLARTLRGGGTTASDPPELAAPSATSEAP